MVKQPQEPATPSELEARTKAVFDTSVSELDANVRSRLTRARHAAIARLEHPAGHRSGWRGQRIWVPAFGLAAAALIALVVVPNVDPRMDKMPRSAGTTLAADDVTILLDSDNFELLEEMEFYAWLDEQGLRDEEVGAESVDPRLMDPARS